jgi:hypothetical protein
MRGFGPWNLWSVYWIVVWFICGFGIPEAWALISRHPQNTLSDQIWRMENNFGPPWTWNLAHWAVAIGCLWLAGHMIWHIWR